MAEPGFAPIPFEEDAPVVSPTGTYAARFVGATLAAAAFVGAAALHSSSSSAPTPQTSLQVSAAAAGGLSIGISNKYGELLEHTRKAYGVFDFVVEPVMDTTFSVKNGREGSSYSWVLTTVDDEAKVLRTETDDSFVHEFEPLTNKWFKIELVEKTPGKAMRTFTTEKITSKWVRREIRKLDVPDRERILRAMEIMYTTDLEEGRELYGKKFKSSGYFAATHSATLTYCYHWGIMFGTTHPAFQLEFEDSIRAIDPRISGMFYWDYFQDDARFGSDWWSQSEIYRDDWFGAVDQSKDDQYQVLTGRFAHTKVPTHRPEAPFELANYNSYGDMGQVCNQVSSSVIQRSVEFCGIKTQLRLASADDMISCFMNSTRLQEWDLCLEKSVHGNLHSLQGGAWDCNNDLQKMVDSDPVKYPQKVMDYIGVSSFNMWFKEMAGAVESFSCKEKGDKDWPCARDDGECAMLNKTIDYTKLTDVEIYEVGGNVIMEFMFETQWGNEFIEPVGPHSQDKELLKLGATYKWKHLPASEQVEFQRWLMEYASNPGKSGIASTGAAPADPLFWVWHSIFDRALHVLRMSEHFKSTYNMQWVPTSWTHCGGQLEDHLPFKNIFDDAAKDHHFTNKELWMLLDPTNQHLPYIYDDLTTWGEQYWDAFFLTVKKGQDRGDFANPDAPANDDFWKGAPESSESESA